MLVLDISGKISKNITISRNFGIVLSNLPTDWKCEFTDKYLTENIILMRFSNSTKSKMLLINDYTPQGTCEEDYCKKFFNLLNYIVPDVNSTTPHLGTNQLFSLIEFDDNKLKSRIKLISRSSKYKEDAIKILTRLGKTIDAYIENDNDFLQLDFLINALYSICDYTLFEILKIFSILEFLLLKDNKCNLDEAITQLFPKLNSEKFLLMRQIRNKIAHGDFGAMKKKFAEYEKRYMKEFWFDLFEYSKEKWIISNVCSNLNELLKEIVRLLLFNKKIIDQVRISSTQIIQNDKSN